MGQLADAVKAATSVVFGTGSWNSGARLGTTAGDTYSTVFDAGIARSIVDSLDAGDLYATQPHLRTVVSFVARNGAQLGRHVYTDGEKGRERVKQSVAADVLHKPNDYMSGYDLFNMLFSELALYDMAVWVPVYRDSRWQIDPLPGEWITGIKKSSAFQMAGYRVKYPGKNETDFIPADQVIVFRGYSPNGFQRGSSAVGSLRGTLGEQVAAMEFRRQMWHRGGRVGMFMSRPKDAPEWSADAKAKFIQSWRNNWSGSGANAGSTPILEDGMELKRIGFNAKEEQWLEAATLSLSTVAAAYHVPPAMVGVSGYNSFASVKEFRKMLYTETLGPSIAQVEDTINFFLFPFINEPTSNYFELNIGEKLQGDFEEQATVLQAAVGGPYMTVNEARSKNNLPKLDGGDELLAPLNMGSAGNSGPLADVPIDQAPSEDPAAPAPGKQLAGPETVPGVPKLDGLGVLSTKTRIAPDQDVLDAMTKDIQSLLKRQRATVLAAPKSNAKADPEWWNQKFWNAELGALLLPHMTNLSTGVARKAASSKGLDPDAYSVARTSAFLASVAESRADLINATTRDQVAAAKDSPPAEQEAKVAHVFDVATESRAPESSGTMATMLTAWAVTEMARQLLTDKSPKKTWLSSGLPDSRHASMNGETVGIDSAFSNGAQWPGDPVLGAKGVANCGCSVDVSFNE